MSKHATITELEAGSCRRVFVLAISGLAHRYVSHAGVDTATIPGTSDTYTDVEAIVHVGDEEWEADAIGGIVTHSPIAIKLASAGKAATDETDPLMTFGRARPEAASWSAIVTESVSQTDTTIKISADPSALDLPTYMHIGAETVEVTAEFGNDPDPEAISPYRLTVVRGIANTVPQRHTVETYRGVQTSEQPEITAEVVAWRTRRAILYIAAGRADGSISEPVEYMRGVIDRTPEPGEGGLSCVVELVPYTALLDVEVPSLGQSVELVDTHHYFSAGRATTLVYEMGWEPGQLISTHTDGATASGSAVVAVDDTTQHDALADITLGNLHPRRGVMTPHMSTQTDLLPTGYDGGYECADTTAAIADNTAMFNKDTREAFEAQLADRDWDGSLAAWPAALVTARAGWTPGTVDGLDGSWCNVLISWESGTPFLNVTGNWDATIAPAGSGWMRLPFGYEEPSPDDAKSWSSGAGASRSRSSAQAWYPVDMAPPESAEVQDPSIQAADGSTPAMLAREIQIQRFNGGVSERFAIRGVCIGGWYQTGERYMLVDSDLPVPASGMGTVLLTYVDAVGGEHVAQARYTSSEALATGYALKMGNPAHVPSVGNWPGRARTRIEQAIYLDDSPGTALLQLLTSSGGQGVNGTYDTLVGGAGLIADTDIDTESFERLRFPSTLPRWQQLVRDGDRLSDIITPILQLVGCSLGMARTDDGRCVLRAMRVGPAMDIESRGTIGEGDWSGAPSWGTDDEVINRVAFSYDQGDDGKSQREIQFNSGKSQKANGEVKAIEIDLPGIRPQSSHPNWATSTLRSPAGAIFRSMAFPRYIWRGMIHTGAALFAQPAAVYTVTSSDLRDADGWGVAAKLGRVSKASIKLWEEGATLTITRYPGSIAGWNASAYIATTPTATTITVSANVYSGERHPFTGAAQQDIDGFAAGDVVLYEPAGDNDNSTTHTITAVDRATNTITFSGAHGMAPGGHIVPTVYDSASAVHQAQAYLSDAAGKFGAADVTGQQMA